MLDLNNATAEELAQLQIELTQAIYNYCEKLARKSANGGRIAPEDVRDFGAYISKQKYKYDKKINEIDTLIILLDEIGSHSKAEWYNHIYRYIAKDYDLNLMYERRSNDEDVHDEEATMID